MLDIKWIRENPEALVLALKKRGQAEAEARSQVETVITADEARRTHLTKLQEEQARQRTISKEIGQAMGKGDKELAEKLKAEVGELKNSVQRGEAKERGLDADLRDQLASIPNVPLDDVPEGADESDNVEYFGLNKTREQAERDRPKRRDFTFKPKEHFELGEALGMMDFERAAKLSGSRFTVLSGQLARLERALGQFMLDLHTTEHGYTEVQPPLLVRDEVLFGTGQLPKFAGDLFLARSLPLLEGVVDVAPHIEKKDEFNELITLVFGSGDEGRIRHLIESVYGENHSARDQVEATFVGRKLWAIPTAEVPLTNLVRGEILDAEKLPLRYTALTPCFRSEAGSAGKDTRGMLRQHQFYKVELVSITDAESSLTEHERMTECAETVLKKLGLPFRTVVLCTGDMGFGARKTYDIEVWLPGQNAYREISSCSVCGDFQGRRMNARYRAAGEKQTQFVHTLNGSGVATGRALIAVMENYQNEDGSISIPEILQPYMGGVTRIESAKG
ncbi:serine--tRNA ligase [Chelativorans xinjiangense]|uniref:serine--tRNA ligase n=1 Tax=Chelativorans xinjiangense TaxID=2681485 RepID=UPI00135744E8|nr:serine--tRNA ligase [Chelativorans xinjiangense]